MGNCGAKAQFNVKLNVYELGPENELTSALRGVGMGVFHSGVEINGEEYAFGGSADADIAPYQTGIWVQQPRQLPDGFRDGARYKETIDMGSFEMTHRHFSAIMRQHRRAWTAKGYNLVTRNCNHFSNAICLKLLNKPIPQHLNRLANTGASIAVMGADLLSGLANALDSAVVVVQTEDTRQERNR
jgi:hypothetical protein